MPRPQKRYFNVSISTSSPNSLRSSPIYRKSRQVSIHLACGPPTHRGRPASEVARSFTAAPPRPSPAPIPAAQTSLRVPAPKRAETLHLHPVSSSRNRHWRRLCTKMVLRSPGSAPCPLRLPRPGAPRNSVGTAPDSDPSAFLQGHPAAHPPPPPAHPRPARSGRVHGVRASVRPAQPRSFGSTRLRVGAAPEP